MEKLEFDSGIQEYRVNGSGVLRFNPADPNVYARFLEAVDKLRALEQSLIGKAKAMESPGGEAAVALLSEADRQMKQVLQWVFGEENDFDAILGGVNLLAVAGNGQRVAVNLLQALEPILSEGARRCVAEKTEAARARAQQRSAAT